ncbi:MAG: efflux RND transporter permease subunit [Thermodesulfobacteriota bacterium]
MAWTCRHPIAVISLSSVLVVAGAMCRPLLPVELLPDLNYPLLTIRTTFGSATPEEVEALITRPVETAAGTVSGLRSITSVSTEGLSVVTLTFAWGAPMSHVAAEVREKLDLITEELPHQVKPPLVMHYDPGAEPVATLALSGPEDSVWMRRHAEDVLKPQLECLPGVAAVRVSGGLVPEIQVSADRGRLSAHRLHLGNVADRIEAANINFPGGKILRGPLELPLRTVGRFSDLEHLRRLPIARGEAGGTVAVSDLAEVKQFPADRKGISRFNGKPAVLLSIVKEPSANTVEVCRRVRERTAIFAGSVASAMELVVADEQGPFVEEALHDLRDNVILGGFLAFLVLFVGLRNVRGAVLIIISIPISLVSTMAFMVAAGVTLNFMSVGGLAIGVGMLVDASIVVLESIHRHSVRCSDIFQAVGEGVAEVRASVISGTLTSVVVLVPIFFMTGVAQRLFRDFAFTMAISHLISLLVALVLLPALVVLTQGRVRETSACIPSRLQLLYGSWLRWALDNRVTVISASVVILVASVWGGVRLGFELLPNLDRDRFTVRLTLPPDSSLESLEKAVGALETRLRNIPEIRTVLTEAGVDPHADGAAGNATDKKLNEARMVVRLASGGSRLGIRDRVVDHLRTESWDKACGTVDFQLNESFLSSPAGGAENAQLLRVVGDDPGTLRDLGNLVVERLRQTGLFKDVGSRGNVWTEQIQVIVDRYKAAARGLSVEEIADAVQTAVEGKIVGKFMIGDRESDIRVRLRPEDRRDVLDIRRLPVGTTRLLPRSGGHNPAEHEDHSFRRLVPLEQVAELRTAQGPREILRIDRRRTVTVHGNVAGLAFTQGEEMARAEATALTLPQGYEIKSGLERVEIMGSLVSLSGALLVALMLTFVVMAVQFESIRLPLVIMSVVPMTIVGPVMVLHAAGIPVNVLVMMGAVVLVGIVVNNGILMVAYCHELREKGLPKGAAILEGCRTRLHPVLMSTATNVLGVMPVCVGWGSGAALRKALALTVASGLIASLFFTLLLLPVLYDLATRDSAESDER